MPRPTTYNSRYKTELSPRQGEVLDLIGRGKTNQQIADALGITLDGAKYHVSEILAKLEVATREDAAALWRAERRPGARVGRWLHGLVGLLSLRPVMAVLTLGGAASAAAGIALLTLPFGGDDATAERPACQPWQMGVAAHTVLGDQSSIASVETGAYAKGGPSCTYRGAVTLSFRDAAGNVLAVDGNGLQVPVEGGFHWVRLIRLPSGETTIIDVPDPEAAAQRTIATNEGAMLFYADGLSIANEGGPLHRAVWWNWCGDYRGPVMVEVTDVATGQRMDDAWMSNPPRCDDPSQPSRVVTDWNSASPQP